MKRMITLVLVLTLVLGLCACGSTQSGSKKPEAFMAGYGNTVITPTMAHGSLTMGGHTGAYTPAQTDTIEKIIDQLPCVCVALTDTDGNTALVYSLETLKTYPTITAHIPAISEATGVPESNILISATHNHHAPNLHKDVVGNDSYKKYVGEQMIKAAQMALEDQKPAKAYITDATLEGYNFCRHYVMSDGSPCTTTEWTEMTNKGLKPVGYVVEADNQLQLVKFVREGGKDIVMLNWQAHPYTATNYMNVVSATDRMQKIFEANNQHLIHFNGACGDVGFSSRITEDNKFKDWIETYTSLAEEAIKLDSTYKEIQTGKVVALSQGVKGLNMTVYGVSFGEAAILFAPCEMFNETGKNIKASSTFKSTIMATNAMDNFGYVPTKETFVYGGYEVRSCYTAQGVVEGTAENMQAAFIELLPKLAGAK